MKKKVMVLDGQGGMVGRQLCDSLLERIPDCEILAIGTNSVATANMLKGKATQGATGENPAIVGCQKVDVICGPIGIVLADALLGEITPKMAVAIAQSPAAKVLIPFNHSCITIAGVKSATMQELIEEATNQVIHYLEEN